MNERASRISEVRAFLLRIDEDMAQFKKQEEAEFALADAIAKYESIFRVNLNLTAKVAE